MRRIGNQPSRAGISLFAQLRNPCFVLALLLSQLFSRVRVDLIINFFVMRTAQKDQIVIAVYVTVIGSSSRAIRLLSNDVCFLPEDRRII